MATYPAPSPPYLGPAAHTSGSGNKPIHRIVIHSTVSPTEEGGARDIAAYFRKESSGGSAHYVVDPGEVVQVVYDNTVAWHAPPNPNSLGVEMCDMPDTNSAKRWNDQPHQRMLDRTAHLVAQLCLAYNVPRTFLSAADLKAGKHGITTHNNVSDAWHESSHWDPGQWPRDHFMDLVRGYVDQITHGQDGSDSTEEDDVSAKDVWAEDIAKWAPDATQNEGKKIDAAAQLNQARGYAEDAYDRVKVCENKLNDVEKKLDQILKKLN